MTRYDFDAPVERHGTDSLKFDRAVSRHRSPDLLSLWVADMDFALPPEITEPLAQRALHGIFGYTEPGDSYFAAVNNWLSRRHGWSAPQKWFTLTPGVVFALAMAVRAFTEPGQAALVQQPVYYPFSEVVKDNDRKLANAPLTYQDGRFQVDFDAFEQTIVDQDVKLFLLCNPHNPVGRAWTADELNRMCQICLKHQVVIVSDEIHMDFARPGFAHTSVATLGDDVLDRCVICTSAGKTFNLASLQTSNIVIPNAELRRKFNHQKAAAGYSQLNAMGLLATQLCYERGESWLDQLKDYLEGNWQLLEDHLAAHAPQLHLVPAESTYLAWIDCRCLGLFGRKLKRFIEDQAGLWLDYGDMFGSDGDGFIRINLATQRAYLSQALTQLTDAIAALDAAKQD
ncbi:MAG: MalY/PatB family protein [Coriobacteriia bacterium]|nr:MalY/PatB family protein [Coriobacteriia bacterium]